MIISAGAIVFAIITFIRKLVHTSIDPGWTSIIVAIFFSLGVELFFIGMVGEYVGRTYMHINREPQYIVRACYNLEERKEESERMNPEELQGDNN